MMRVLLILSDVTVTITLQCKEHFFKNLIIFGCAGSLLLHTGFLWLWQVLFIVVHGLLTEVAFPVAGHRL